MEVGAAGRGVAAGEDAAPVADPAGTTLVPGPEPLLTSQVDGDAEPVEHHGVERRIADGHLGGVGVDALAVVGPHDSGVLGVDHEGHVGRGSRTLVGRRQSDPADLTEGQGADRRVVREG